MSRAGIEMQRQRMDTWTQRVKNRGDELGDEG